MALRYTKYKSTATPAQAPQVSAASDPYGDVAGNIREQSMYSQGHGNTNASSEPGMGQGKDFTVYRQGQALNTLQQGITNPEAGDYANRDALRQALGQQISQYGGAADARERNFMANQERGLSNNVAQLRRQMGGAGLSRSSQRNRSLGEVLASSQRASNEGLNAMQLQKGQELGQLAQANQLNLAQALQERGFSLTQAQALANLLQQQAQVEQNSILGTATQPGPSDFEKALGYGLQGLGIGSMFLK